MRKTARRETVAPWTPLFPKGFDSAAPDAETAAGSRARCTSTGRPCAAWRGIWACLRRSFGMPSMSGGTRNMVCIFWTPKMAPAVRFWTVIGVAFTRSNPSSAALSRFGPRSWPHLRRGPKPPGLARGSTTRTENGFRGKRSGTGPGAFRLDGSPGPGGFAAPERHVHPASDATPQKSGQGRGSNADCRFSELRLPECAPW